MDYSSSHDMDMDDLSPWHVQQQAHNNSDDANIDPRLLNNAGLLDTVGTWSSEESSNSNGTSVPTAGQTVQDVNRSVDVDAQMTYAPAAPVQTQPSFPTPTAHYEQPWQMAPTPMNRYPTRHQLQQMPPTPDTSYHSQERGQNVNAYQHGGPAWQSGNRYGLLSVETAHMPQYQDPAAGNVVEQSGPFTPNSQQQFFDDAPPAPSPLTGRGPPHEAYGQPIHDQSVQGQPHFAVNVHGWDQTHMAPSEDIPTWSEGPYHVPNTLNTLPLPPNATPNNNGKKEASVRSGITNGSFICGCGKVHDSKSELDHHARNHDASKRTKRCSICNKAFLFDKDVKRHMKTHQKERHIFCNYLGCPWRDKGFKRQDHLERHLKTKHKQEEEA